MEGNSFKECKNLVKWKIMSKKLGIEDGVKISELLEELPFDKEAEVVDHFVKGNKLVDSLRSEIAELSKKSLEAEHEALKSKVKMKKSEEKFETLKKMYFDGVALKGKAEHRCRMLANENENLKKKLERMNQELDSFKGIQPGLELENLATTNYFSGNKASNGNKFEERSKRENKDNNVNKRIIKNDERSSRVNFNRNKNVNDSSDVKKDNVEALLRSDSGSSVRNCQTVKSALEKHADVLGFKDNIIPFKTVLYGTKWLSSLVLPSGERFQTFPKTFPSAQVAEEHLASDIFKSLLNSGKIKEK